MTVTLVFWFCSSVTFWITFSVPLLSCGSKSGRHCRMLTSLWWLEAFFQIPTEFRLFYFWHISNHLRIKGRRQFHRVSCTKSVKHGKCCKHHLSHLTIRELSLICRTRVAVSTLLNDGLCFELSNRCLENLPTGIMMAIIQKNIPS